MIVTKQRTKTSNTSKLLTKPQINKYLRIKVKVNEAIMTITKVNRENSLLKDA